MQLGGQAIAVDHAVLGQGHGVAQGIEQLADVARPGMGEQALAGRVIQAQPFGAGLGGEQGVDQLGAVAALAQGRQGKVMPLRR